MATAGPVTAPTPRTSRGAALGASVGQAVSGPALAFLPGALTVYLAFESGGFFPGATALAAVILALALLGRVLLADNPFSGMSVWLGVAAGALMLLAAWTLASALWSDSSARATFEFDRVLLYLLALSLFGTLPREARTVRWLVWGVSVGMVTVCVVGLITKTLPEVWSAPPEVQRNRLSYPIGYWNALGLTASLALVFCLHLTCSAREPRIARVLAAAAMPVLGATLLFTFSRGPAAVAVLGLVAYVLLGRPKLLMTGLVATLPTMAFAVVVAYQADLLAKFRLGRGFDVPTPEVIAQGQEVALIVGLCAAAAAAVRLLGIVSLDSPLARLKLRRATRRRLAIGLGGLAALVVALAMVAAVRSGWLETQYDRLFSDPVTQTGDYRDRLFNPGLNRLDRWQVALDGFKSEPFRGHGAGTYALLWERERPTDSDTTDAHSLYLEMLAELGLVGGLWVAVVLLAIFGGLAVRLRGANRSIYAALLAAALVWAAHAALDWDWELPVVTLWLFAAGGVALAGRARTGGWGRPTVFLRLILAAGLVVLAITPVRAALSEAYLADGLKAYEDRRCQEATDSASQSISALSSRAAPYEVMAFCQVLTGREGDGVASMAQAVKRDPRNWEYRYGLALVRGFAELDPRPAARAAARLNPREELARMALSRFRGDDPRRWRVAADELGLSIP